MIDCNIAYQRKRIQKIIIIKFTEGKFQYAASWATICFSIKSTAASAKNIMEAKCKHVSPSRGVAIVGCGGPTQNLPCWQICRRNSVWRKICSRPLVLVDVGIRGKFTLSEDWFERSLLCRQIGVATPQKISLIYAPVPKSSHTITSAFFIPMNCVVVIHICSQ